MTKKDEGTPEPITVRMAVDEWYDCLNSDDIAEVARRRRAFEAMAHSISLDNDRSEAVSDRLKGMTARLMQHEIEMLWKEIRIQDKRLDAIRREDDHSPHR